MARLPNIVDQLRAFAREDDHRGEIASGMVREFHRTLNTTSGLMAAGIVLSGGDRSKLTLQMNLALLFFLLSLVAGLMFLHFMYLFHQKQRERKAAVLGEALDAERGPTRERHPIEEEKSALLQTIVLQIETMSSFAKLARVLQMCLVAVGFGLVFWSLGVDLVGTP